MRIGRESINKYIEKKSLHHAVLEQELQEAKLQLERLERDLKRGELVTAFQVREEDQCSPFRSRQFFTVDFAL